MVRRVETVISGMLRKVVVSGIGTGRVLGRSRSRRVMLRVCDFAVERRVFNAMGRFPGRPLRVRVSAFPVATSVRFVRLMRLRIDVLDGSVS